VPSPKILFNLAKAHLALGNALDAYSGFSRFLQEATEVPPEAREEAERAVRQLQGKVAFLTAPGQAGVTLYVDGQERGITRCRSPCCSRRGATRCARNKRASFGWSRPSNSNPGPQLRFRYNLRYLRCPTSAPRWPLSAHSGGDGYRP
jgi:hypothetical protein